MKMKFNHLLYMSRMNLPYIKLMKEHPHVIYTKTTFSEDAVKCQMLISKPIKSSYAFKSSLKNIEVEISKKDMDYLIEHEQAPEHYKNASMVRIAEQAAICKAFTMEEITDYICEHPKYLEVDAAFEKFNRARGIYRPATS